MTTVVRTVSSAELKNLTSNAKLLVAGLPSHFYSLVHAVVEYVAGTTPYTTDGETLLSVQLGGDSGSPLDSPFNFFPTLGFLSAVTKQIMRLTPNSGYDQLPNSLADGLGVYLSTNGSDVSDGNGTLKITLTYEDVLL